MKRYDVVIVGAGPAGIEAAKAASETGASVLTLDDNASPGGQIWRGSEIRTIGEFIGHARVIDGNAAEKYVTVDAGGCFRVSYGKLILATGARELFLPFPGWTSPHVMGVGGIQALAKSGFSVAGKRIIVAGSGPLLLAVAAYLQEHGATVPIVAEQASRRSLAKFGWALLRHSEKIGQALELRKFLKGARYLQNCWVTRVKGREVSLSHNGSAIREECDYLATGFGFVPNTELAGLIGCRMEAGFVGVDEQQQTSVTDIYCAGEPTGLGGVDKSVMEGRIAGGAAAGQDRGKVMHFLGALNRAFALRPEVERLAEAETMICRCEDVPLGRIENRAASWKEMKLHYRCGMGPCQGRICGPIIQRYFKTANDSIRPPIFPTTVENLIRFEEKR